MNPITSPEFRESSANWLSVANQKRDTQRKITSKLKTIKAKQNRLERVQRDINRDIQRLSRQVSGLKNYIEELDLQQEVAEQEMALCLRGES